MLLFWLGFVAPNPLFAHEFPCARSRLVGLEFMAPKFWPGCPNPPALEFPRFVPLLAPLPRLAFDWNPFPAVWKALAPPGPPKFEAKFIFN